MKQSKNKKKLFKPYYKPNEITKGFENKVIGTGCVYALRHSSKAEEVLNKWHKEDYSSKTQPL
jgi:hypothetical protein